MTSPEFSLPERIVALLNRVESVDVETLLRAFGEEARAAIDLLVVEKKVVREGKAVRLA